MRITAGQFRGRNLFVPDTEGTRPTMDRTRQAVFNILRSASWALKESGEPILFGARVLDVFAGSGAMGFEALSQGASFCAFVEQAKPAIDAIQKNIDKIGLAVQAQLIKTDVLKLSPNRDGPYQIAFLDPPYHQNLVPQALQILQSRNYITDETLLVLEMNKTEEIEKVVALDTRRYGVSKIVFAKIDQN